MDLLFIQEVADLTRIAPNSLRNMRTEGRGPKSFKLGRRVVYKREDVLAWIDAQYNGQVAV